MSEGRFTSISASFPKFAVLFGFASTLLLSYPGFMSWDSVIQLTQAREWVYSDHHPPVMSFTWSLIDWVIAGPFGMLLLQLTTLWWGLYLLQKHYILQNNFAAGSIPLISVLFPSVIGIIGVVWKDIQMAGWLTLALGLAVASIRPGVENAKLAKLPFLAFWACLILAIAQRHNAIGAALGLVWFLFFSILFQSKGTVSRLIITFVLALPVVVLCYLSASGLGKALTSQEQYPWRSVVAFDIVGIAKFADDADYMEKVGIDRLKGLFNKSKTLNLEALQGSYNPADWTDIFNRGPFKNFWRSLPGPEERQALKAVWLTAVQSYPTAYLEHRWTVFTEVMGFGKSEYSGIYFSTWRNNTRKKTQDLHHANELSGFQWAVFYALRDIEVNTILFKPYVYALLTLVVAGLGTLQLFRRRSMLPFFVAMSGVGIALTLYLGAPATDYRYSHWMVFTSILGFLLLIYDTLASGLHKAPEAPKPEQ